MGFLGIHIINKQALVRIFSNSGLILNSLELKVYILVAAQRSQLSRDGLGKCVKGYEQRTETALLRK